MILMPFVMKSFNFITYFISPLNQQVKLADVDLLAKIDFQLPSQMNLFFPLAKYPAKGKIQTKSQLLARTKQRLSPLSLTIERGVLEQTG